MWVALAAVAIGVWFLVRRWAEAGFDLRLFFSSLARANPAWIAAAGACVCLSFLARACRWQVMILPQQPDVSIGPLYSATFVGFAALLTFGRPGEFVRPWLIAKRTGLPVASQIAAWLLERIYDTLIAVGIFGISLTLLPKPRLSPGSALRWLLEKGGFMAAILSLLCLFVLILLHRHADTLSSRLGQALQFLEAHHHQTAMKTVEAAVQGLASTRNPSAILLLFIHSLLVWSCAYFSFFSIFHAFPESARFDWVSTLVCLALVSFGAIIQIPGIGGGVQLVAVLVLTEIFHLHIEPATGIAFMIWFVTIVVTIPAGLVLALKGGVNWHKLKQIKSELPL